MHQPGLYRQHYRMPCLACTYRVVLAGVSPPIDCCRAANFLNPSPEDGLRETVFDLKWLLLRGSKTRILLLEVKWPGDAESNRDLEFQRLQCCHYTISRKG